MFASCKKIHTVGSWHNSCLELQTACDRYHRRRGALHGRAERQAAQRANGRVGFIFAVHKRWHAHSTLTREGNSHSRVLSVLYDKKKTSLLHATTTMPDPPDVFGATHVSFPPSPMDSVTRDGEGTRRLITTEPATNLELWEIVAQPDPLWPALLPGYRFVYDKVSDKLREVTQRVYIIAPLKTLKTQTLVNCIN